MRIRAPTTSSLRARGSGNLSAKVSFRERRFVRAEGGIALGIRPRALHSASRVVSRSWRQWYYLARAAGTAEVKGRKTNILHKSRYSLYNIETLHLW